MIGTVLKQRDQGQVRVAEPAPGLMLCAADFPAGGSCAAPPPDPGRLELLFCRSGRLQLAFGDGRAAALGPGDLLVRTAWSGRAAASAPLGGARFTEMAAAEEALRTGDRELLGKTMPAKGLTLLRAEYGFPLFGRAERE